MDGKYEAPQMKLLGTVEELTLQLDKNGSTDDIFTPIIPQLDGTVEED